MAVLIATRHSFPIHLTRSPAHYRRRHLLSRKYPVRGYLSNECLVIDDVIRTSKLNAQALFFSYYFDTTFLIIIVLRHRGALLIDAT